ncbi:MAG: heme exporter protein CcmB [Proteobacteria bacterium]|nr:heme exporter protein CcmB [Pseudomonadota bacterium]
MSLPATAVMRLILRRELKLSFRRPDQLVQPLVFFLIVATLFPLAMNPQLPVLRQIAPGVLWVGALLSSLLAVEGMFRGDADDGTLEQMVLSGHGLSLIVTAKTLAHWLISGVALVLVSPLMATALNVPSSAFALIMAGLALGTLTLSWLGAIGAALTVGLKRGSVMLSLIVLPLAMPLLIFGASATDRAITGDSVAGPMYLLGALCLFTTSLAPFAAAAALRITLE